MKNADLAERLAAYLIANPTVAAFGTRTEPSQRVAEFQRAVDISPADGVMGPAERSAARDLGVLLPPRPMG